MLDKLEKLEEKINEVLSKLIKLVAGICVKIFLAIIPNVFIRFFNSSKSKSINLTDSSISKFSSKLTLFKNLAVEKKDSFFHHIDLIQKYPVKEKGLELASKTKSFILSKPPKEHLRNFLIWLKISFKAFLQKLKFLNSYQFKLGLVLSFVCALGFYTVYFGSSNIFNNEYPSREIASVQEYDYRPDYRFYDNKTLEILNMKVPIFVEDLGNINSITIDFSLRVSTKFSKYYLQEYEYKLKDYFFTSVEPVESDFPIHTEGKEVLKEAIQAEINNFLIDNNVEGEVLEVNILYMVGS